MRFPAPITPMLTRFFSRFFSRFCLSALAFSLLYLSQPQAAHGWFMSLEGAVAPLSTPLNGRIKVGGGGVVRHFLFEGSVSNIPVPNVTLYDGLAQETIEDYPVFLGLEGRYYFLSPTALTKRHDFYMSLGADFPILAQSFIPAFKVGGGYALKVHRRIVWELGVDYYFYGALTNALYVGSGIKVIF